MTELISLNPIGFVHFCEQLPQADGDPSNVVATVQIEPAYEPALRSIQNHSHFWMLSWLHQADRNTLQHQPKVAGPEAPVLGVFGLRTSSHPNPIGLSLVRLLHVEGCTLTVEGLDLFTGTHILDIKPYFEPDCIFSPETPYIRPVSASARANLIYRHARQHHQEECSDFRRAVRMAMLIEDEWGALTDQHLTYTVTGSACLADCLQGITKARLSHPPRFQFIPSSDLSMVDWYKDGHHIQVQCKPIDPPERYKKLINCEIENLFEVTIVE